MIYPGFIIHSKTERRTENKFQQSTSVPRWSMESGNLWYELVHIRDKAHAYPLCECVLKVSFDTKIKGNGVDMVFIGADTCDIHGSLELVA